MIINLLSNAYKYTQEGRIDVRASGVDSNGSRKLLISIEDSGIGIPQEEMQRLFKLFVPRKSNEVRIERSGMGMGLTISRSIVSQFGGELQVESVLHDGSTFSFTFAYNEERGTEEEQKTMVRRSRTIEEEDKQSLPMTLQAENNLLVPPPQP